MAKFRNVDKRRLWESPEQRRVRREGEKQLIEKIKWEAIRKDTRRASDAGWPAGSAKAIVAKYQLGQPEQRALELEDVLRIRDGVFLAHLQKRQIALGKEETWAEYFHFGLTFYRLQKWLRSLWATANFRRPSVWMTMRHLKEGGRHEIVAH